MCPKNLFFLERKIYKIRRPLRGWGGGGRTISFFRKMSHNPGTGDADGDNDSKGDGDADGDGDGDADTDDDNAGITFSKSGSLTASPSELEATHV